MKILTPKQAIKYCLKCGSKLNLTNSKFFICVLCGRHQYINPIPTNGVIIENNKGEILLVQRGIEPKKGQWDTPGGFIEPNETIFQSVVREIKEELNLLIRPGTLKIIGIYPDTYDYQGIKESTLTIIVSAQVKPGKITPQDDVSDYKFIKKKNILSEKIAFSAVRKGIEDYLKL